MSEVLDAAPEAQSTDLATLPPADRAAIVLNSTKTEADLKQLAESLKAITVVNSQAGREQAHALAMTARSARTTIEKAGKAARDDATKFSKAVIAEEDRLIEIIQPQETRVLGLRNAWDAAEAARKEAELQKERDRIGAHQAVLERIRNLPGLARQARTSAMALQMLEALTAIDINGMEEFKDEAAVAKIAADEAINDTIEAIQAHEAEQALIKAEQEAEAARLAEQRRQMEAERAEAARVAAEQQAELLAMQAKMKAQQEELDRQAAEVAKQAAELAARRAEADKPAEVLAADPRDALAQVMAGTTLQSDLAKDVHRATYGSLLPSNMPGVLCATPTDQTAEPTELIQQDATTDEMHDIGNSIMYGTTDKPTPTAMGLVANIANNFDVDLSTAIRWLAERADEFKTLAESKQ